MRPQEEELTQVCVLEFSLPLSFMSHANTQITQHCTRNVRAIQQGTLLALPRCSQYHVLSEPCKAQVKLPKLIADCRWVDVSPKDKVGQTWQRHLSG